MLPLCFLRFYSPPTYLPEHSSTDESLYCARSRVLLPVPRVLPERPSDAKLYERHASLGVRITTTAMAPSPDFISAQQSLRFLPCCAVETGRSGRRDAQFGLVPAKSHPYMTGSRRNARKWCRSHATKWVSGSRLLSISPAAGYSNNTDRRQGSPEMSYPQKTRPLTS